MDTDQVDNDSVDIPTEEIQFKIWQYEHIERGLR